MRHASQDLYGTMCFIFQFFVAFFNFFFIKLRSHPELNCFRGLLSFTWMPGLSYGSQRFPAIVFPDFSALAHLRSSILSKFSSLLFPLTSDLLIPPCLDRRGAPPTYNVGALWMGSGFICAGNFFDRYSITCNVEDHARFLHKQRYKTNFIQLDEHVETAVFGWRNMLKQSATSLVGVALRAVVSSCAYAIDAFV